MISLILLDYTLLATPHWGTHLVLHVLHTANTRSDSPIIAGLDSILLLDYIFISSSMLLLLITILELHSAPIKHPLGF